MRNPKLSIVTASFNSECTIKDTFNSILKQSYRPLEYVVVDGGSTDSTVEIIKQYENTFKSEHIEFKWLSEKDSGIYNAWNKALKLCTGAWISFLGSDDIYYTNALKKYAFSIENHAEFDFVTAKTKIIQNRHALRVFGEKWSWNIFKKEMKVLHSGGFINRNYFTQFGIFDESFKIAGDYEHLLRKGKKLKVFFIDEVLVEMGADGVSDKYYSKALKEAKNAKVKNGARSIFLANLDFFWVWLKIKIKSILYAKK